MLGFVGVEDIEFVRAEALAISPDARAQCIAGAPVVLVDVSRQTLALAA